MSFSTRPPRLREELERIAAERADAERQMQRIYRWELVRVCCQCLGSCAVGAALMGYAMHVDGRDLGAIFWWGGMLIGYSGITIALATAYQRGEERGDW